MGGNLYMMDATRMLTAQRDRPRREARGDLGDREVPPHRARRGRSINDAMDVARRQGHLHGAVELPRRARTCSTPVAITVEGANILTRSLIIFGQGAIRCHPFVLKEIAATREPDRETASIAFDAALFGHLRFTLSNLARTLVMGLTGSHFVRVPADVAPRNAPLLPAAHALLGGARVPRRRVDGHARRRAEAQGEALGAARRHPVAAVPVLGDAASATRPRAGRPRTRR